MAPFLGAGVAQDRAMPTRDRASDPGDRSITHLLIPLDDISASRVLQRSRRVACRYRTLMRAGLVIGWVPRKFYTETPTYRDLKPAMSGRVSSAMTQSCGIDVIGPIDGRSKTRGARDGKNGSIARW